MPQISHRPRAARWGLRAGVTGAVVGVVAMLCVAGPASADSAFLGGVVTSSPIATGRANSSSSGQGLCPAGTALVGASTMTTQSPDTSHLDYPYKLVPDCASLDSTPTAVVPSGTTVAGTVLQGCSDAACGTVGGKPSVSASAACPAGAVVTQLEAVSGWWVDDLILGCQALDVTGAPTGAVSWLPRLGGNHNAASPSSPVACPNGSVAVGLSALTGDGYFEDPRLECAAVIVPFTVTGFLSPVSSAAPTSGKAGRTFPLKFQLQDPTGAYVTTLSAVTSITSVPADCTTFAATGVPQTAQGTAGTALRYDMTDQQYVFNWKSPKAGGCYAVTVTLSTGQTITADFSLT